MNRFLDFVATMAPWLILAALIALIGFIDYYQFHNGGY